VCYSLFRFSFWIMNLMIECKSILACMFLLVITWMERKVFDTLTRREKFIIIPTWRERLWENNHMIGYCSHNAILDNLMCQKKFCKGLILHGGRKIYWLMCLLCILDWEIIFWSSSCTTLVLIEDFHCVIVTKHSMSLMRIESNMRT
jgi:hypothetical protein